MALSANRASAWYRAPRLLCSPNPTASVSAVWPSDKPIFLFRCAANASASGPICTAAAPQRVGGLHGMPALHASLAALAFPDGNAKLPDHSAPHDLFLIL